MPPRYAALVIVAVNLLAAGIFEWRGRVPFTSDQAVVALMAEDIRLRGAHPVFYYGAEYAGTLEPHYVAAVFAVFGPSPWAFRAAMAVLLVLCVLAVWAAARSAFGERAGLLAGLYLAAGPSFFLYKGLCSDGAYTSLLLLSAVTLWLLVDLERRFARDEAAALRLLVLGAVLGLAWWVHTPSAFLGPVVAVSALAGTRRRWLAPATVARVGLGFLAGSLPWWARNIETGFASVRSAEMSAASSAQFGRQLQALFADGWSTVLGGRSVWTVEPTFPGATFAALTLLGAVVAAGVWRFLRDRDRAVRHGAAVCLAALLALSALCLAVSRTDFTEPRYLFAGYAALAPLIGAALGAVWDARGLRAAAIALIAALNLGSEVRAPLMKHRDPLLPNFADFQIGRLAGELGARGVRSVYASYWVAYKLVFLTEGRLAATPLGTGANGASRIRSLRETVDADAAPAFLLSGEDAARFAALVEARGWAARRETLGAYSLFGGLPPHALRKIRTCACIPTPLETGAIALLGASGPETLPVNGTARFQVRVRNASPWTVSNNVHLSYHWLRPDRTVAVWDGHRAYAAAWPPPGGEGDVEIDVVGNVLPGRHRLVFDLVDEQVAWLGRAAGPLPEPWVEVVAPTP